MKIRLGILTKDLLYASRLTAALTAKYSQDFEIYSFTKEDIALKEGQTHKIEIMLADETIISDENAFLKHFYLVYLTESRDIEFIRQQPAVFKYQKTELIVKQLWNLYSEVIGNSKELYKNTNTNCRILAFASPCGGCGSSSMAAAAAVHFARHNKKTMYLNLEKIGSSDVYFHGDGTQNFSDIIFALKGKKANLALKIEACLKQDSYGVSFFSQTPQILDMYELNHEEEKNLIQSLAESDAFDVLILDLDFDLHEQQRKIYALADAVVLTDDGSEVNNQKLNRAWQSLNILEQSNKIPLTDKIFLLYNQFKPGSTMPTDVPLNVLGTVPYLQNTQQMLEQLSAYEFFSSLL